MEARAKKKTLTEAQTLDCEEMIPSLASTATHTAHLRALASGYAVVLVNGTQIVSKSADGQAKVVGKAKPRHKVKVGQRFKISTVVVNAGT
jgi:hypothetical protein